MTLQRLLESPIGPITVVVERGAVTQVALHGEGGGLLPQEALKDPLQALLMEQVEHLLSDYFQAAIPLLEIPCRPQGTAFQLRVWQALREIPVGEVRSYGELAEQLGSSPRAVGGACRSNPIPLLTPCHRVVAKSGIGGFSGQWGDGARVDVKAWLLRHERGQ